MKLMHPIFSTALEWRDNSVCTLVLESPAAYRECVFDLLSQAEGLTGEYIVSDNNEKVDTRKIAEIITDCFNLNVATKALVAGIYKEINQIAMREHAEASEAILMNIQQLISEVSLAITPEIAYSIPNDIAPLLKAVGVSLSNEYDSPAEKLLSYITLCNEYLGKKLFVIPGVHTFLSTEELCDLFADLAYREIKLLCIEPMDFPALANEVKKIIDADLCEL